MTAGSFPRKHIHRRSIMVISLCNINQDLFISSHTRKLTKHAIGSSLVLSIDAHYSEIMKLRPFREIEIGVRGLRWLGVPG